MDNTNNGTGRVLVLVEKEGEGMASTTFEVLGTGRRIANDLKGTLLAAIVGHEVAVISQEIAQFANEVYSIDHPSLAHFKIELFSSCLEQLCKYLNPDIVLMGGTIENLDLAPRLAYKMGVQAITDCIQIDIDPETENLLCTKPVYGGRIISTFQLNTKPYILILRPKTAEHVETDRVQGQIVQFNPVIDESLVKTELIETVEEESVSLNKAEAVISGGRGIKDADGLKLLSDLIKIFRGYFSSVELGATRPLIDAGFLPSSRQVGLTGEKVAPQLYIAVGISGAMQHLTGILGSKKIIAINSDPEAPIFKVADYGVIGSYEDVVPAFRKRLEELL
jgi:electron transfer flavoprotein alpha subunit